LDVLASVSFFALSFWVYVASVTGLGLFMQALRHSETHHFFFRFLLGVMGS
jgi:hypothetical protein